MSPTRTIRIARRRIAFALPLLLLFSAAAAGAELPGNLDEAVGRAVHAAGVAPDQEARLRTDLEAAVAGGADPTLLADLLERAARAGSGSDGLLEIGDRARRLAGEDLPANPVMDRYLQGLAKGVSLERIRAVADGIEERLREFSALAAEHMPGFRERGGRAERMDLIDQGAYDIGVGVPREHLGKVIDLAGGPDHPVSDLQAPLLALGCLVAGGVDPDRSYEVVETAWKNGYRGGDLERIGRDLGAVAPLDPDPDKPVVDEVLRRLRDRENAEGIARYLEMMDTRQGLRPPGMGPTDDPASMRGPGGPPESPGDQGTHGRTNPPGQGPQGGGPHGR